MALRLHNGHVLGVAAFIAPTLGLFAPLGMAPLVAATALAGLAAARMRGETWPLPRGSVAFLLALGLGWAAISLTWDIVPIAAAAFGLVRLTLMILCGLIVAEVARGLASEARRSFERLLIAGVALGLICAAIERIWVSPLRRLVPLEAGWSELSLAESYDRGLALLALFGIAATLALWRRHRGAALGLWLANVAVILAFPMDAAKLAVAIGTLVALLATWRPRATAALIGATTILLLAVGPVAVGMMPSVEKVPLGALPIPSSAHHRLIIWKFTADRIAEKPIAGWGYDSSRAIPGNTVLLNTDLPALPLHPHNGLLQWWLELGAVGAALGGIFLMGVLRAIRRIETAPGRAAALGLFAGALTVASLSFGIWQGWWVATLFLSTAALIAALREA
jgi:O-antigen ligase